MALALTIDSDIAKGGGAIVLYVCIRRVQKANEDGDGAGVDELLAVFVCWSG